MQTCLSEPDVHSLLNGALDLAASEDARAHLDDCDGCRDVVAALAAATPRFVDRYQIRNSLGHGTMGEVFEADDPQLNRQVAIKMLRPGTDDTAAQARLLSEARSIAQISHPNVVAVFDAGMFNDEVFIAMELIRGTTMRARQAVAAPWQDRLRTCIAAGRGLAAVHVASLVHRDIKPDNVLISDDGRVLVTDFGLVSGRFSQFAEFARDGAADSPLFHETLTQTGVVVGTPAYMAPELLIPGELQLPNADAKSDQFSFAVMTYEALAGQRPFVAGDLTTLQHALDQPLSGVGIPRVPKSIVDIIKRGLARDPDKRWPTVTAMLDALSTSLRRRRQHRWFMAGAAGIITAGVTGAVLMQSIQSTSAGCEQGMPAVANIWNQVRKLSLAEAFVASNSPLATETLRIATTQLDGYSQALASAINDGCRLAKRSGLPMLEVDAQTRCFETRKGELRAVLDAFARPTAEQVQRYNGNLSRLVSPSVCSNRGELLNEVALPSDPAIASQVAELDKSLLAAAARYAAGGWAQAEPELKRIADAAQLLNYAPLQARAEKARAKQLLSARKLDEANQALERALLAAERSRDHRIRADIALARAFAAQEQGDNEESLKRLDLASAVIDSLDNATVHRAHLANYRSTALAAMGRNDDAQAQAQQAVALYILSEGASTTSLSNPYTQLAFIAYQRGDLKTALSYLRAVVTVQEQANGAEHPEVAQALGQVAMVELNSGQTEAAEQDSQRARAMTSKVFGTDSLLYAHATRPLIGIATARGDLAAAEQYAREALRVVEKIYGVDTPQTATFLSDLANTLHQRRDLAGSLAAFERVVAIHTKANVRPAKLASAMVHLAEVWADMQHCDKALPLYQSAQRSQANADVDPFDQAAVSLVTARCLVDNKKYSDAQAHLTKIQKSFNAPTNPDQHRLLMQANFLMVQALWATGDRRAATKLSTTTLALFSSDAGEVQLKDELLKWQSAHR
jgi:eukaryotic-like serine/threonine-protein kinase